MALKDVLMALYGLVLSKEIADSCEAAGWLPFYDAPFVQLLEKSGGDSELLKDEINNYYLASGDSIVMKISAAVDSYQVDREAKETFREALKAHEHGLYRCPPRVLLPEIERIVNVHLLKTQHNTPLNRERIEKGLQNKYIEDLVEEAFDLDLFKVFIDYLFERFDKLGATANANIPNRAAATHGWQQYSTQQASMNAIICADYLYRILP